MIKVITAILLLTLLFAGYIAIVAYHICNKKNNSPENVEAWEQENQ